MSKTKQYLLDAVEKFLEQHPDRRVKPPEKLGKSHPVSYYYGGHGKENRTMNKPGTEPIRAALGNAYKLGIIPGGFNNIRGTMQPRAGMVEKVYPKHLDPSRDALPDVEDIQSIPGFGKGRE